jgi:RiboL-PSP-HEPN
MLGAKKPQTAGDTDLSGKSAHGFNKLNYINEIFCKFDSAWGKNITSYMEDEIGAEKIQSIVSNRNRIAHGEAVSLGVKSLIEWAPEVRKLCLNLNDITTTAYSLRSGRSRRQKRRRPG